MQPTLQVPGVYIVEQNAFPNSVVEVATAIPAFVGYTEKAVYKGKPLSGVPTRVASLKEFEDRFGGAFKQVFDLVSVPPPAPSGPITGGTLKAGTLTFGDLATAADIPGAVNLDKATIDGAVINNAAALTAEIMGATLTGITITGATIKDGILLGGTIAGTTGKTSGGTTPDGKAAPSGPITGGTLKAGTLTFGDLATAADIPGTVNLDKATIDGAVINNAAALTAEITGATLTGITITGATIKDGILLGGTVAGTTGKTSGGTTPDGGPTHTLPSTKITFDDGKQANLTPVGDKLFYLYNSLHLFYLNGGGPCYIVSIGDYDDSPDTAHFTDAFITLEAEQDPTMLLCPDALMLKSQDYYTVVATAMLAHCAKVQRRVALFDVYGGAATMTTNNPATPGQPVTMADTDSFRTAIGENNLNYGIAYFPWMNTAIVSATDLSFLNLSFTALSSLADSTITVSTNAGTKTVDELTKILSPSTALNSASSILKIVPDFEQAYSSILSNPLLSAIDAAKTEGLKVALHNKLKANSPKYGQALQAIATYLSVLPVAPAMAGVFTAVDASRGVWKAPANVSLNAVVSPTLAVSDDMQAGLNVDALTGKSINVIRTFKGLGTLVWGARTLDGNSQDWRYINVRRTIIMIEQSIKLAARNTVFEPNDANTWATFKSMLESFLFTLWKQGALAGATAPEAYQVQVGLGSTMTDDDVHNGIMRVSVKLALVRPAEFIVVNFQQLMQTS